MKIVFFISFTLSLGTIAAQTPLIAHKSHSGNAVNYFIDPNSNFGEIYMPPEIYKEALTENFVHWELLDDSTIVKQVTDSNQRVISVDYITNKDKLSIDYFKYQFDRQQQHLRDSIWYIEYEKNMKERKTNEQVVIVPTNPGKPSSPSFLLIFFAVSAVGMILMRLFSRPTTVAH